MPATRQLVSGATRTARALAFAATLAVVGGVAFGQVWLIIVAGAAALPLLVAPRGPDPARLEVACGPLPPQLVEGDPTPVEITVRLDAPAKLTLTVEPTIGAAVAAPMRHRRRATAMDTVTATITVTRWGPADPPTLRVAATSRRGLRVARTRLPLPLTLVALPRPAPLSPRTLALTGQVRVGNHVRRTSGAGVEFAGVRPYQPGDPLRQVNWSVSSKRGSLHVTERAAESSTDVVLAIDTFTEAGRRGASTLDASVRGAAGLARALLRGGDRVGLVLLGGMVGWLVPAGSRRAWYRIVTAALRVAPTASYVTPDLTRVPRVALPPAALVVLFTPLLDERALTVAADLTRRRYRTIVVDVLPPLPAPASRDRDAQLGERLWRLQRAAVHAQLRDLGCAVVRWHGADPLDVPLHAALRAGQRPRIAARPG